MYIGYHEGAYTGFVFDVSEFLDPGEHLISVRVDNPEWSSEDFKHRIIPNGFDLFNHGGIEREIVLEAAPLPSVVRADVRMLEYETTNNRNGSQEIEIDVVFRVDSSIETLNLSLGIYPLQFSDEEALMSRETWEFIQWTENATSLIERHLNVAEISGGDYAALKIPISLPLIHYWSTKSPNLYAVTINLTAEGQLIDFFCTQTGFRTIEVSETELHLNGAGLKLAGVSLHEQYPKPIARMLNDSLRFSDLQLVKDLNANWWRGHYPFHPMSYLYSDRLGLACWAEAPVIWINEIDVVQAYSRNYFEAMWIEILYRDINRPSILMWGATNEPWAQGPLYKYLEDTKNWFDLHDPSRIVSFAAVSSHDSWTQGFKHLDICTPNTYAGTFEGIEGNWYSELTRQLWRVANNTHNKNKPIVSMEFGYWRGGESDEDQKRCFEEAFQAFSEHPSVQGMTWWIFADYHGPDYYNSMGIYNQDRTWHSPTYNSIKHSYAEYTASNL